MFEVVTPAKAGVQQSETCRFCIPEFAGMTAVTVALEFRRVKEFVATDVAGECRCRIERSRTFRRFMAL